MPVRASELSVRVEEKNKHKTQHKQREHLSGWMNIRLGGCRQDRKEKKSEKKEESPNPVLSLW